MPRLEFLCRFPTPRASAPPLQALLSTAEKLREEASEEREGVKIAEAARGVVQEGADKTLEELKLHQVHVERLLWVRSHHMREWVANRLFGANYFCL